MKLLVLSFVLALAIRTNGLNVKDSLLSDKEMFLRIIECAQKAVVAGIPEIGLPSHDPLRISKNFSVEIPISDYTIEIALENMVMEGIPWWNVTQMDDVTEEADTPVFDYTIYWKLMSFEGNWRVDMTETETGRQVIGDDGTFGFEFDHLTFAGLFNITKPADDKEGGFNELTVHLHTEESELHFNGLGVVSDLIKAIGGPALTDLVNLDLLASVLGQGLRDKLNRDWIQKPERVEALISHCDDTVFK